MVVPSLLNYTGSLLENQSGLVEVGYMQWYFAGAERQPVLIHDSDGDIVLWSLLSV